MKTYCSTWKPADLLSVDEDASKAFVDLPDQFKFEGSVNWPALLQELRTTEDRDLIKAAWRLSGCWVTCACGNQCDVIPRGESGYPVDSTLKSKGLDFCNAMEKVFAARGEGDRWNALSEAAHILHKIEERSEQLLKAMCYDPDREYA